MSGRAVQLEYRQFGSGGAGIRFQLAREHPLNLRFDWAYGKDGSAYYLSMGEAF